MKKYYSFYYLLLVFLFLFVSQHLFAQPGNTFTTVGAAGFSAGTADNTAFTVSKNDNKMFMAYRDGTNGGKLVVMQYNGTSWAALGSSTGISAGAVNYSIGIATINTVNGAEVYVAFSDASQSNKLTIMRWGGLGWTNEGAAGSQSSGDASSIQMTATNNGDLFVAYSDLGSGGKAFVKKRVSGTWTNIAGTGISAGIADDIDIACGNDNQPYIVYKDGNASGKATVRKYNGSAWNTVGTAGFTSAAVSDCSIAVDRLNRPNISFNDGSVSNRATVRYFDGTTWQVLGFAGISSNAVAYTSLTFDYDNNAYVIYKDNSAANKATLKKYNGTTWTSVVTTGFSAGAADFTNIEFDTDQKIYVGYRDVSLSSKAIVQQLSCNSPTTPTINAIQNNFTICAGDGILLSSSVNQNNTTYSWYQMLTGFEDVGDLTELNDNSTNSGVAFSSVTDASGNIFVVKMQTTDSMIVVKRFAGGVWQTIGGAVGKSAGFANRDATDIAFDPDGNLYVSYIDFAGVKSVVVKKFVSNNWVNVGPTVTDGYLSTSLYINSYGMMALASGKKNGSSYYPTVFVNNGNGWIETPEISTSERIGNIDVAIDRLGNVIVGFISPAFSLPLYDAGIPKAYSYNGTSWTNLPLGLTENSYFINVATDSDNTYYISTNSLGTTAAPNNLKVYVMRSFNQGASFTNIAPSDLWNSANRGHSIELDNYGIPYLGYATLVGGISKYKLVKYVSGAWVNLFATAENANVGQMDIFFDKTRNAPLLLEVPSTANINKANVFRIEKKFLSTGGTRYTTVPGDYVLTADAGCNTPIISAVATVIQSSATNNWTGAVSTEFNDAGNWSCGRIPIANDDVVIPAGAPRYPVLSATLSPSVSLKGLTIASGASITLNGQTIKIAGNLTIQGTLNASAANSKIEMNGTSKQTITAILAEFMNVTINNPQNVEISPNPNRINGTLTFLNGKLIVLSSLTVGTITGYNTNRYIVLSSGDNSNMLRQNVPPITTVFYPIGNSDTSYTPVEVSHTSSSTPSFAIKVLNATGPFTGSNAANYVNKRFRFSASSNTKDFTCTLYWNSVDENSNFNRNACAIVTGSHVSQSGYNEATILDQTASAAATVETATSFSRTINGVRDLAITGISTTFYKDMYITSQTTLLPIQLLSFTGKLMNNSSAILNWKITTSSNPKQFIIEKSTNALDYVAVGTIEPTIATEYEFISHLTSVSGNLYYRLKMIDTEGKITYSSIVKFYISGGSLYIKNLYPQPVKGEKVQVGIYSIENTDAKLVVTDLNGKLSSSLNIYLQKGDNQIELPIASLPKGFYLIRVVSEKQITNTVKMVKE